MIKKFIVNFCLLVSLFTLAQQRTSSPYSFYGIGDIKFKGTVENRSMGGVSVFPDSIHINLQNPAHLASLKLTCFSLGGTSSGTKIKTETQEEKTNRASFDYFAVGIPAGKLGFGFGLVPYSSVGYKIQSFTENGNKIYNNYDGDGGVNKVFIGLGYQITKNFAFGADVQYNFGTIETTDLHFQDNTQYGTRKINLSNVQGFNANFGMTYNTKLNDKLSFFSSLTYTPESELKLDNSREIETVFISNLGRITPVETETVPVSDTNIKLPNKVSLAAGVGQAKKWSVGAEVTFLENSVMSNRPDITDGTFENSVRYSLGGYFIPNYVSYSDYYKKISYRGGLRYENTGLVINNESINDRAANIGLGLPVGGTFSNINIGLEFGKRGTKSQNLVQENYLNLSIGLSLSDKWFIKRKYD